MAGRRNKGGQRPQRVGEQIRQILGELLLSGQLKDPRLDVAGLISFTEVRVTSDLSWARVFTSVFPYEEDIVEPVMNALENMMPQIRALVAREMNIKHTPELRFCLDNSMEQGARIDALLKEVHQEDAPALASDSADESEPT